LSSSNRCSRGVAVCAVILVSLSSLGCIEHALRETIMPTRFDIPTPPEPAVPKDGAIWRGGTSGGSFLYFDRKARGLGDLVTVIVDESVEANGAAETGVSKTSALGIDFASDVGYGELVVLAADTLLSFFGLGTDADGTADLNIIDTSATSGYDGEGSTSRSGNFQGIVTCRVVEVLPGGLFHIYGRRQIVVNHDLQLVTVDGIVRREDIGIDNNVPSTVLADLRLTYDGAGVIDDKQRPSLLSRWFDLIYPF